MNHVPATTFSSASEYPEDNNRRRGRSSRSKPGTKQQACRACVAGNKKCFGGPPKCYHCAIRGEYCVWYNSGRKSGKYSRGQRHAVNPFSSAYVSEPSYYSVSDSAAVNSDDAVNFNFVPAPPLPLLDPGYTDAFGLSSFNVPAHNIAHDVGTFNAQNVQTVPSTSLNDFPTPPLSLHSASAAFEGLPLPGYNPSLWTPVPPSSGIETYVPQTRSQFPPSLAQLGESGSGNQGFDLVGEPVYIPDATNPAQTSPTYTHHIHGEYVPGFATPAFIGQYNTGYTASASPEAVSTYGPEASQSPIFASSSMSSYDAHTVGSYWVTQQNSNAVDLPYGATYPDPSDYMFQPPQWM